MSILTVYDIILLFTRDKYPAEGHGDKLNSKENSMLSFQLNTNSDEPLYEQIYNTIKSYIIDGSLAKGYKLPSTRVLSSTLNVSRNTIDTAYYQLLSEGFINSVPKSGFYVSDIAISEYTLNSYINNKNCNNTFSSNASGSLNKDCSKRYDDNFGNTNIQTNKNTSSSSIYTYDFSPFEVDLSHFPYSVWKKLSKQSLDNEPDLFLLGEPFGDIKLRTEICSYVRLAREVECSPEQIIIGAGADWLLQMLSLTFMHIGITEVTMENPCYIKAAHVFKNNSLTIHTGELDQNGLIISSISDKSNLVYVTPSHEYPLGIVMPYGRRRELLKWADKGENRYIIEDDHDSEFRYKGKPIPSLHSMDNNSKVIYAGTFSKAVAPAIRVSYIILPHRLLKQYTRICGHYSCSVSRLDQSILTRFIADGYFEKHINRMKKIYKSKHDTILSCLEPYIKSKDVKVIGANTGLHLVLVLNNGITEDEICSRAALNGIKLYGLKEHYLNIPDNAPEAVLLGYSNLTAEEIKAGIDLLISCF